MTAQNSNNHECVIYIKATREAVWEGLTSAEFTRRYFHATEIESRWKVGAPVIYYNRRERSVAVEGEVLEAEFPSRLSITWPVHYNEAAKLESPSRVTFILESVEDATKLTVVHDRFQENSVVLPEVSKGWIAILRNLKTLLETGSAMAVS